MSQGVPRHEIEQAIDECDPEGRRPDRLAEIAAMAAQAMEENNSILDQTLVLMAVLLGVLALIRFLGRTPLTVPLKLAAQAAITRVQGVQVAVQARRAANDQLFAIFQQEAANAARFAQRAGAR